MPGDGDPISPIAGFGDGDPFPYLVPFPPNLAATASRAGKYLGVGEYRCNRVANSIFITASGGAPINVRVILEQALTATFPPSFALAFIFPEGELLEQKSFVVQRSFHASEDVGSVRVKDANGWHDIPVEQGEPVMTGFDFGNA